jgi:hypothetical protein
VQRLLDQDDRERRGNSCRRKVVEVGSLLCPGQNLSFQNFKKSFGPLFRSSKVWLTVRTEVRSIKA